MNLNKQLICALTLLLMLITFICLNFAFNHSEEEYVKTIVSPIEFVFRNNQIYKIKNVEAFEDKYSEYNHKLAQKLNITDDEAFIMGCFGKYWAKNILEGRNIHIKNNNLIYYKFSYFARFENSAFCIENGTPANKKAFERLLKTIRKGNFVILNLDTDISYPVSKENASTVNNFVVVRKSHIKQTMTKTQNKNAHDIKPELIFNSGNIKIVLSDFTTKLLPDRDCSSYICKEILNNINKTKNSIDMAIYGYSSTPKIEQALINAKNRGVKIRVVFDSNSKNENIYPDTFKFMKNFPENKSDLNSNEAKYTMHNKFYIFDNRTVISGSANLSHTDMSGYNSNSIIVIENPAIAKFYSDEFEQMYKGLFHNDKSSIPNKNIGNIKILFSPQDKIITNSILPLIKKAKKYIYIPAFVITENNLTKELILAKNRGVEIRVITDALNASTKHSKHKELRKAGILVKAENYAGKMHSKTIIIDDKYLIIGSMNFSFSGENRNDENVIILENSDAAKFYKKYFLYQWDKIPDKWLKYTPRAEGKDSIGSCSDGIDNNYDGYTDMEDSACKK